jgi:hypothetical protein
MWHSLTKCFVALSFFTRLKKFAICSCQSLSVERQDISNVGDQYSYHAVYSWCLNSLKDINLKTFWSVQTRWFSVGNWRAHERQMDVSNFFAKFSLHIFFLMTSKEWFYIIVWKQQVHLLRFFASLRKTFLCRVFDVWTRSLNSLARQHVKITSERLRCL